MSSRLERDQRVCGYPVCPAVAAACSAPRPLRSRWLTFAPFCSRNSQANSDPCRQHRDIQTQKVAGTGEDIYFRLCASLIVIILITASFHLNLHKRPPHPNSSSNKCRSSLLLSNGPVDLCPFGQCCCHGNQISHKGSPVQTQPRVVLLVF